MAPPPPPPPPVADKVPSAVIDKLLPTLTTPRVVLVAIGKVAADIYPLSLVKSEVLVGIVGLSVKSS